MKHIAAPKIQHHVTDEGPPRVKGVLKVVATLEQRPMMLNAKLICGQKTIRGHSGIRSGCAHRGNIGELALEGRDISNFEKLVVIVEGVVAAARD